ncbi:MAG: DCC1-like thiol-disulfide oxidoreductase family protein [Pseudomonadota bacterium]
MASLPKYSAGNFLVYDGDCPFCSRYVAMLRLQARIGPVTMISAREGHPLVTDLTAAGYDLNEGIVFIQDGVVFFGAQCMQRLALLSADGGLLNTVNARIFRSARVAKALYPALRAGRNLSLKLLGRARIET